MSGKKIVDDFDWENNTWEVIDTFFKQDNILINHHLTSFNYFMEKDIQAIVREKEYSTVKVYNKDKYDEEKELYKEIYEIEFGKVHISKPVLYDKPNKYMYPNDARLRKLTYGANIYLDIHHRTINIKDNGEVKKYLSDEQITDCLEPNNYVGHSHEIIDRVLSSIND